MTTYEHMCENCQHEWEEEYGMKEPVPTLCPNCKVDGKVKRLISGGYNRRGTVELTGMDLRQKLRDDAQVIKREAGKNESVLANLVGEARYSKNLAIEKVIRENRPKIQSRRKSQR